MGSLLEEFAGKIDLIYIDPPFATGVDFSVTAAVGDGGLEITKEQSIIEEKAYRDTWGQGTESYLSMFIERVVIMKDLLSECGSIYVHCDYRISALIRLVLEEVFSVESHQNEIIWHYIKGASGNQRFGRKHNTVFWYSKGPNPIFNRSEVGVPYNPETIARAGRGDPRYNITPEELEARGKNPGDVWSDIPPIQGNSIENVGYDTQKPEALLDRIIKASSNCGDLIADFFCGSGTTLAVAEKLGRRWIGCDLGRYAIHTSRKRLLGIEGCKPFEILNLGKYERQYWQGITFQTASNKTTLKRLEELRSQIAYHRKCYHELCDPRITDRDYDLLAKELIELEKTYGNDARCSGEDVKHQNGNNEQMLIFEYIAFMLKLYNAQPLSGMQHLHGKKGRAMVHIGAVDAPVTIDEINAALAECIQLKQAELHILGWEWEMGLNDLMVSEAKKQGVKLLLLSIPREVMEQQAVDKGDIQFFELAYLKVEITIPKKLTALVKLQDFVIPNTELIPEDVRSKVKKWSDYIDYWAVDWDFKNDTFMQGWVTYRTRKDRTLALASDSHNYDKPGKYRVLVKVVDIFGNDTTQGFDVEVK